MTLFHTTVAELSYQKENAALVDQTPHSWEPDTGDSLYDHPISAVNMCSIKRARSGGVACPDSTFARCNTSITFLLNVDARKQSKACNT